jgi:hypothetical protein
MAFTGISRNISNPLDDRSMQPSSSLLYALNAFVVSEYGMRKRPLTAKLQHLFARYFRIG